MAADADGMITLTGNEQDVGGSPRPDAAPTDTTDLRVTENRELGVYEATIGGRTAAGLVYEADGNRVTLLATSVLPEYRGKGVAARLTGAVLDQLREEGKTATITCPFATAFVNGHPEYADVLDPAFPGPHIARHRG